MTLRSTVRQIPVLGPALARLRGGQVFDGSTPYWDERYRQGGNSGAGSYGRLARFKADFLNQFVAQHDVATVVELGCGDGAQVALATYPTYLGLDISPVAVEACEERFSGDTTNRFEVHEPGTPIAPHDLALSLDVIYHLVEDEVFDRYMHDLFAASSRWVIVYASNEPGPSRSPHVRHRRFTDWIDEHEPAWHLAEHAVNAFPAEIGEETDLTSFADFYVFTRGDRT